MAKEGSHPWQAAIFSPRKGFACGGSVITDWHILSSGYCIRGYQALKFCIISEYNELNHQLGYGG